MKLSRIEKCKIAIERGFTCNVETGIIFGIRGKQIKRKDKRGYIEFKFVYNKKEYSLRGHSFIYYYSKGEYDINLDIDHINGIKDDNRIENLRLISHSENMQNTKAKGYGYHKGIGKWQSYITVYGKKIHLGCYDLEADAIKAREEGKLKYHIY